jgi:hypothetical protein
MLSHTTHKFILNTVRLSTLDDLFDLAGNSVDISDGSSNVNDVG